MTNQKHYNLIVGHDFSISNETDADIQSDYSPGIWAIKSQKSAMKYCREYIAEGHRVSVSVHNPKHHALANMFIKELGIKQELFKEPEALKQEAVSNGKPSNLAQLKKYLAVGTQVHVKNHYGAEVKEKDTSVLKVQTNQIVFEKTLGSGIASWFDLGKASEWIFTNEAAKKYDIDREGAQRLSYEIIY